MNPRTPGRCDFCGAPKPTWSYPCVPFARRPLGAANVVILMTGHWQACDTCHRHIEANRWKELLDRSCGRHGARLSASALGTLRADTAECWLQFLNHRTGPAAALHGSAAK